MNRKLLVGAAALMLTGSAMADAINEFSFELRSSDDKMYVCNAGLMHHNGTVGYTDTITDAGSNSGLTADQHDYMKLDYRTLNEEMELGAQHDGLVLEAGDPLFATPWSTDVAFGMKITKLDFSLMSEQYGAKMFVDICYRGPQIDFLASNIKGDFRLTKNLIKFNHMSYGDDLHEGNHRNLEYLEASGLKVSSTTVCDTQLTGSALGAGNGLPGNGIFLDLFPVADKSLSFGPLTIPGSNTRYFSNAAQDPYAGPKLNGPTQTPYDVPRYCVTRYVLEETNAPVLAHPDRCEIPGGFLPDLFNFPVGVYAALDPSCGDPDLNTGSGVGVFTPDNTYTPYHCANDYSWKPAILAHTCSYLENGWVYTPANVAVESPRDWRVLGGQFTVTTEISNVKTLDNSTPANSILW